MSVLSCGGGGGNSGGGSALLNGSYLTTRVQMEEGALNTSRIDITANGNGTGSFSVASDSGTSTGASGTFTYSISPDRMLSVSLYVGGVLASTYDGVISADGSVVVFTDTDNTNDDVSLAVGVKKTSGLSAGSFAGDFRYSQFGSVLSSPTISDIFTGTSDVVSNGAGNAPFTPVSDSRVVAGAGPTTYSMSPAGLLEFNDGSVGLVSSSGNFFITANTQEGFAGIDMVIAMGAGIKKSTAAALADVSGEYLLCQIGKTAGGVVYTSQVKIIPDGNGAGDWEILKHSNNVTASGALTYTVDPAGLVEVTTSVGTDRGIVSSDGSLFVLSDTDSSDGDGEVIFAVGIKK